jgi:hypothetical protein
MKWAIWTQPDPCFPGPTGSGLWLRSEATLVDGLHEDGVRETARAVARREATINTHLVLRPGDANA